MKLVIFDCDGVLVDSEPMANRILAECLTEIGLPMTWRDSVATFMGRSWKDCLDIIESRLGEAPGEGFVQGVKERMHQAFRAELQPVPGIIEALNRISRPMCVASSSTRPDIRHSLELTGLWEYFSEHIFSAEEVARGKPHPDLFLHAARSMGHVPEACVVVEDSGPGVEAAVAAGMEVLGHAALMDGEALRSAGATVFHHMAELPELLGE